MLLRKLIWGDIEWTVDVESNVTTYDEYSYYVCISNTIKESMLLLFHRRDEGGAFALEAWGLYW
jgi:hypothetical protein